MLNYTAEEVERWYHLLRQFWENKHTLHKVAEYCHHFTLYHGAPMNTESFKSINQRSLVNTVRILAKLKSLSNIDFVRPRKGMHPIIHQIQYPYMDFECATEEAIDSYITEALVETLENILKQNYLKAYSIIDEFRTDNDPENRSCVIKVTSYMKIVPDTLYNGNFEKFIYQ